MTYLLHISDLHLGSRLGNNQYKLFSINRFGFDIISKVDSVEIMIKQQIHNHRIYTRLIRLIINLKKKLKDIYLVITGDLCCSGHIDDLSEGKIFISRIKKLLGNKFILIPGNHDRFKSHYGDCGCRLFDEFFDYNWNMNDQYQFREITVNEKITVNFHSYDFCLKEKEQISLLPEWYKFGAGIVDKKFTLKDLQHNKCNIILMHFNPLDTCKDSLKLINNSILKQELHKSTVQISYIFCGHTHNFEDTLYGDIKILCADSACSATDKDIDNNKKFVSVNLLEIKQNITSNQNDVCLKERIFYKDGKFNFLNS